MTPDPRLCKDPDNWTFAGHVGGCYGPDDPRHTGFPLWVPHEGAWKPVPERLQLRKGFERIAKLYDSAKAERDHFEGCIRSALGEDGEFPVRPDDWPKRPFYWRKWLREKSGLKVR